MPLKITARHRKETDENIWYITGSYLGTRVRLSLGTTDRKEAKKLADEKIPGLMASIQDGRFASGTFGAVALLYKSKGKSDRFLEPLIEKFGKRPVNAIRDEEVFAFADSFDWKPETKNRQAITPFQAVCNFGARQKPPLCAPRLIERYDESRRVITAAPDDWFRAIVAACEREGHTRMIAIIMFLSLTAARISEACRLQWEDVNLAEGWALIRMTKSGHPRRVELHEGLVTVLERIGPPKLGKRVFGYAYRWSVLNRLKAICRRNSLPYYSSHKWGRHAFAARLLRMNKSLLMVKDAGGWASLQVVVDNYGHLEHSHVAQTVIQGGDELTNLICETPRSATTADTTTTKPLIGGSKST